MANVPPPRKGKASTGIAIAAAVVVVLVGLGTIGFVGMIVAYAMLHAPPPHVATGADANAGGTDGGAAK